jgi:hypothetical protein
MAAEVGKGYARLRAWVEENTNETLASIGCDTASQECQIDLTSPRRWSSDLTESITYISRRLSPSSWISGCVSATGFVCQSRA